MESLHTIKLSTQVMIDLEKRILCDIRSHNPNVIIVTARINERSRVVTVKANTEGINALHNECKWTADDWHGEYCSDKSNMEVRRTWQAFARAEALLAKLIAK